jgi:hypothetical protein
LTSITLEPGSSLSIEYVKSLLPRRN